MIKTREQSLFDEMYRRCQALGFVVYDYRPMVEVPYPFVEMEETSTAHRPNKTDIKGSVELTLSVWGLQKKRKQVSDMAAAIFHQALAVEETEGYFWCLAIQESDIRMLEDNTTVNPLKRALIRLVFRMR